MNRTLRTFALFAVIVIALALLTLLRSRTAPIPPVFSERLTYAQGLERAATSGKPLLVFATADWCGPCQSFKRSTLVEPEVESLIRDRFIPVYLNIDENQDAAASLAIHRIPASVVLKDGRPAGKLEGAVTGAEYVAWLNTALASPPGA